ncbi:hypothetical protein [Arenibaculum sp.]|jgi:diphthamide synthase subunit DPH2|uniref:hypothetical protein n=1 Tax=Arenibaculum sp. TaxID=2865862 RepID=UPI002E0D0EE4|nr:hypothetical protein [Arenibaculum sp.]
MAKKSSATRVARHAARKAEAGLSRVCVWVPAQHAPDLRQLAERLAADRELAVGPLRNTRTGKLVRL